MRISPICACPPCTARLISGALKSGALECTVICDFPPVAFSTYEANCMMFSVWKLAAGYGVGMSHLVCAATDVANAANRPAARIFGAFMGCASSVGQNNDAMNRAHLFFAAALAALFPVAAAAHEHGEQWILANEYPATSLPGEGDVFFARLVADTTEGRISIITMPDAKMGYKSREQLMAAGEINAVLSSGDGGAGRKLWEHLPRFTEINYAVPLSFTTVNLARWKALDDDTRKAIENAAAETEARQWQALEGRLAQNYARMRENGMAIDTVVAPALRTRLRESARGAIDEWSARAGPEARAP